MPVRARIAGKRRGGTLSCLILIVLGTLALAVPMAAAQVPSSAQALPNTADYLEVTGYLDSSATSFLVRQIAAAQEDGSSVLIIRVDSPGAVAASVDPVVHAMNESRVPIVVWVAAGDAKAGGAASLLMLAAHRAVIGPEATIGPAAPLDLKDFRDDGDTSTGPAVHAIEQSLPSGADPLPRQTVERLVTQEIGADEAVDLGLADGVAPNVQELLLSLRGLSIDVPAGAVTLSEDPVTLRFVKMGLLERLAHSAMRPEFAYLLLIVGLFGFIFELYNPGLGAGGLFGAVAVGFSAYSFVALPVSWLAVAALLLAFALLSLDLSRGGLGLISIFGYLLLLAGTFTLYGGAHPAIRLSLWAAAGGFAMTALFFIGAMTSAIRARTAKPIPGADGILEAVGVARTDIAPDGQVMARGTLWRARTLGAAIGEGTAVKVKGVSGLMLMVEPTHEEPDKADAETPVDSEPLDSTTDSTLNSTTDPTADGDAGEGVKPA